MMGMLPALAGGFHTQGTKLLDANGKEFVLRGINYSYAWQKYKQKTVIPAAKNQGCNAVRIQLGSGKKFTRCTAAEVAELISLCEENKLVGIFNVHDPLGSDNIADLEEAVEYWKSIKTALDGHENTVIINIANEWFGTWKSDGWAEGYAKAIPMMREAGFKHTLMVDCAGWGQYPASIAEKGSEVAQCDPDANIVFSIHMYDAAGKNARMVRYNIDNALKVGVPVVIGEFACQHNGNEVAWQTIMDACQEKSVGYMAWSWTGNDDPALNLFNSYDDSSKTTAGTNIIDGSNGIKATARECSVFSGGGTTGGTKTIWTGPQPIDWGSGKYVQIAASVFGDAEVNDRLLFNITYTGNTDWPQISLSNGNWTGLAGAGNTPVNATTEQVRYYITGAMLAQLRETGLVVSGIGFTLNSIEMEKGSGAAGYENAVWIGHTAFPADWSSYVALPASCFTGAGTGQLLRLNFTGAQTGAQISLRNNSWGTLPDTEAKPLDGIYAEYTVTDAMLAELQKGGMIVAGCGFTLTSVDLIDPASVVTLGLEIPVTGNWVWTAPGNPQITVRITNPTQAPYATTAELRVTTDKQEYYTTLKKSINLAAGATEETVFSFAAEPGFYRVTVIVNNQLARAFNIGYEPEKIVSAPDMQSDFNDFWTKAKAELAGVEPEYKLTKIENKSTSRRNVYLVEMKSIADSTGIPATIRAYYAEPTAAGTYPAIIHYQGYDSGGYDPWCMGGDDNPGYIELIPSVRGQLINNRPPYTNTYGDWVVYGLGSEHTYYYRQAYMDALRAVDFICSREKAQKENIFAEGASQGGALTIAAAALDGRLNSIAPSIPFMGDFPDYFKVGAWPAYPLNIKKAELGMSDAELFRQLSYFDTKNLATRINCPLIMTLGLQDNVCPPHTNIAPYNNLPATVEKSYSVNAELAHETPAAWHSTVMRFFADHLKTVSNGIADITGQAANASGQRHNLQGQRVDEGYKGLIIQNGKKYTNK